MKKIIRGTLASIVCAASIYGLYEGTNLSPNKEELSRPANKSNQNIELKLKNHSPANTDFSNNKVNRYGLIALSVGGLVFGINSLVNLIYFRKTEELRKERTGDSLG